MKLLHEEFFLMGFPKEATQVCSKKNKNTHNNGANKNLAFFGSYLQPVLQNEVPLTNLLPTIR